MRSCRVCGVLLTILLTILLTWLIVLQPDVAAAESTAAPPDSVVLTSDATGITYRHGIAYLREPSYLQGFTHFRFVNPDAPKGGRMRVGQMGSWDNFNAVSVTGLQAFGISVTHELTNYIYDTLLTHAIDTTTDRYGRLAEGVAVDEDGAWIAFLLREGARWHDGRPITTDDYAFTFDVYKNRAAPMTRMTLEPFERLEILNEREIRYWVSAEARQQSGLALRIGVMALLPEHYWESRDITRPTLEPPLGSGPYRIKSFKPGRSITYERVDDYWARDIPVNRGRYNFDELVLDYFRDDQVLYEAIKGDLIDVRQELVPARWATGYDTPALRRGDLVKELSQRLRPAGLFWPIFWNMRVERFQDVRVREALYLLQDAQWTNRVLHHGFWGTPTSFFHDSEFAHLGTPSERELQLLEPIRHLVPPRVFTEEFKHASHQGPGWNRDNVLRALALFREAGWVVRDNVLVSADDGRPFELRLLAPSPALAFNFMPYTRLLKKAGIQASVSAPENSSWLHRSRVGDFDGNALSFEADNTPELMVTWMFSSATVGDAYSPNWAGIQDPAVDKLIGDISQARTHEDSVAAVRALDRVLMWNFYYVPAMSHTHHATVYWNRFGQAEAGRLVRAAAADAWWWDAEKANRVARAASGDF